jgi:hypothetical protein
MRVRHVALGALVLLGVPACRMTPDEIQRIETENELLREQIERMRAECTRYRTLDLELGEPPEEPGPP